MLAGRPSPIGCLPGAGEAEPWESPGEPRGGSAWESNPPVPLFTEPNRL